MTGEKADGTSKGEELLRKAVSRRTPAIESFSGIEDLISSSINSEEADAEILDFLKNYSDKEIETQIGKFAAEEKYEVVARLKSLLRRRQS